MSSQDQGEALDHYWRTTSSKSEHFGAFALIEHRHHHHHLPPGLLLHLLSGLLLPLGLHLLPSSINIESQCGVVLLHLLKLFLDGSQFTF
jgi:hypothetical protein